jgi:hypothetical protein
MTPSSPLLAEGKAEDVMPPPLRRWSAVPLDPLAMDEAVWQTLLAAIRAKLTEPAPDAVMIRAGSLALRMTVT